MKRILLIIPCAFTIIACQEKMNSQKGFIAHQEAILRAGPKEESAAIANLPLYSDLEVLHVNRDSKTKPSFWWYKIQSAGTTGWIQGKSLFLSKNDNSEDRVKNYKANMTDKWIEAGFVSDLKSGVPPELMLHKEGTFNLSFNRCSGMMNVSGKYIPTMNKILLYEIIPDVEMQDRIFRTIFSQMLIELEWTTDEELKVINELSYDTGIVQYGFCAPNQGENFILKK